ncbi:MAG: LPS export ABC transporter permease LptF [Rickettsiales bacterium]|nr:LPS export ABC transporter permease LptF [Rickettsiales bacterium]
MHLYSRYLFTKTVAAFLGFISILICLIWFSRAISLIKYVTENGIKISQFLYLFLLILPWLLLFIVPVSLFAAILMTYNRMLTNNEITILKNSGLTKLQICRPVAGFAVLCSMFCFLNSFYLMPYSNQQMRLLRYDFKNNYASLAFSPQTFETLNNLTIYARDRDKNNNLFGILLNDERSKKYSVTITAKKGNIVVKDSSALLYMEDGTVQKFNRFDSKSEILNFDDYVFNLTEDKQNAKLPRWNAKERFFTDLLEPEADTDYILLEKFRAELHERITFPLFPIIFSLIALSAILHGQFNRNGNTRNVLIAAFGAVLFLISTLTIYDLIASSAGCIPLLYLNIALFIAVCLKFLTNKKS